MLWKIIHELQKMELRHRIKRKQRLLDRLRAKSEALDRDIAERARRIDELTD
jgi:predicted  nucleic acid-binding Zn-ribbon protein